MKSFLVALLFFFLAVNGQSIVSIVSNDGDLSDLLNLVQGSQDVLDALSAAENITLFAPINTINLDSSKVRSGANNSVILFSHVVAPGTLSTGFTSDQVYPTLSGFGIRFVQYATPFNDVAAVNGARITAADIPADNGVIHKIGDVAYPPLGTVLDIASGDFSILGQVVGLASSAVQDAILADRVTVFAPNNAAFTSLNATLNAYGLSLEALPQAVVDAVLSYHLVSNAVVYSVALPTTESIEVTTTGGFTFNIENAATINTPNSLSTGTSIIATDLIVENGVVHGIDTVLLPPGVTTVLGFVTDSDDLSVLESLVGGQPDVLSALQSANNITLFAPVNPAAVDMQRVMDLGYNTSLLLSYHVAFGTLDSTFLVNQRNDMTLQTLTNDRIRFNSYSAPLNAVVTVNGVRVNQTDAQTINGIVHKVNSVLYPPAGSILEIAANTPSLSILVDVVGLASQAVRDALAGDGLTVFAPNNDAFVALNQTTPLASLDQATIDTILQYHVLGQTVFSAALPPTSVSVATVQGQSIAINAPVISSSAPEDANIVLADVLASNGVVHVIDNVLLPDLTATTGSSTGDDDSSASSVCLSALLLFAPIFVLFF